MIQGWKEKGLVKCSENTIPQEGRELSAFTDFLLFSLFLLNLNLFGFN